ncbi:hypothetical protein HYQ46_000800 [Verticillium longisporum]|nr:hypothetical protein HYQ46_000800 [Verticillium longisporum]
MIGRRCSNPREHMDEVFHVCIATIMSTDVPVRTHGTETEASDQAETPGKRASAGDKACLSDQRYQVGRSVEVDNIVGNLAVGDLLRAVTRNVTSLAALVAGLASGVERSTA